MIVHYFTVRKSIEDDIQRIQKRKTDVINAALGSESSAGTSLQDFKDIFDRD